MMVGNVGRAWVLLLLACATGAGLALGACGSEQSDTSGTADDAGGSGDSTTGSDGAAVDDGGAGGDGSDGSDGGPTIVDVVANGGDAGAPANPGSLFDPNTHTIVTNDAQNDPTLVYPVNDTMFPQNIYRVLFQWQKRTLTYFQLSFTSPTLKMNVYTDGVQATCVQAQTGGACWESTKANWQLLAGLNAGQDVTLKIRGVASPTATTVYESRAYTIHFSRQPVPGALYYWSTTVAGVRRGALGDPGPTSFLTPPQANNKCVACHTLSRNGKKLAADVGGENLTVVDVSPTTPPPVVFGAIGTPAVDYPSSWATFNPTTTRVIGSKGGVLTVRDGSTGAAVPIVNTNGANSANGLILPNNEDGFQPDWAPDGAHVVFSRGAGKDRGGATSIAWVSVNGDTFSNLQDVFARASNNELLGYPMFNPTSNYIAFVRGPKIEKDLFDQIWLVPAQAAGTPQLLVRANTLVNDYAAPNPPTATSCSNADLTRCIENNMPTWAPAANEPQLQWIAFASQRDYGFVLRNGSTFGSRKQQLWIAAIDTSKLGNGDPSFPAFRVPFVELTENAHRPFWAEDAINPPDAGAPPGDGGACLPLGANCLSGAPCCGGDICTPDNQGNYVCLSP
jgi:hypothetical protein